MQSDDAVKAYPIYMEPAIIDQQKMIDRAKLTLANLDFDLFAGRGVSGAIVAPLLAYAMNKRFVIVRKSNDGSHDSQPIVGDVRPRDRWIFVDDFISSGATRDATKLAMADFSACRRGPSYLKFLGSYLYAAGIFGNDDVFEPA